MSIGGSTFITNTWQSICCRHSSWEVWVFEEAKQKTKETRWCRASKIMIWAELGEPPDQLFGHCLTQDQLLHVHLAGGRVGGRENLQNCLHIQWDCRFVRQADRGDTEKVSSLRCMLMVYSCCWGLIRNKHGALSALRYQLVYFNLADWTRILPAPFIGAAIVHHLGRNFFLGGFQRDRQFWKLQGFELTFFILVRSRTMSVRKKVFPC